MYSGYSRARINDKKVTELIGLLKGIVSDDRIEIKEVDFLVKWIAANQDVKNNPVVGKLFSDIHTCLSSQHENSIQLEKLLQIFKSFTGSEFELGEDVKSSAGFFDQIENELSVFGKRFAFSGTFLFGSRNQCEEAILERGGSVGNLVKATDYLVIGEYATDSWIQPSFGRKIEKAMEYKSKGSSLMIVAESDWRKSLDRDV